MNNCIGHEFEDNLGQAEMQKYFHVRESNNGIHTNKGDKWKTISIDTAKAFDKKYSDAL